MSIPLLLRFFACSVCLWTVALAPESALSRQLAPTILGNWTNEEKTANISISLTTNGTLEGHIAPGGRSQRLDIKNPDPALRGRVLEGIKLMWDFSQDPADPNVWKGGTIYDPKTGNHYSAVLRLLGEDGSQLHIRGYMLTEFLGRTTVWSRGEAPPQP